MLYVSRQHANTVMSTCNTGDVNAPNMHVGLVKTEGFLMNKHVVDLDHAYFGHQHSCYTVVIPIYSHVPPTPGPDPESQLGLPDALPYAPHGLRATLWCPFLTPTTPTLPLFSPKKPSIRPDWANH
jgi:hypothetical protein